MVITRFLLLKSLIIIFGCNSAVSSSEFFSSAVSMELLLQLDLNILDRLDILIAKSEERIKFLKRERYRLRRDVRGAAEDPIAYVSNPISAFLMTKRLVRDYRDIDDLVRKGVGVTLVEDRMELPTENDLQGVTEGLSNLQFVYGVKASVLARGDVFGRSLGRELNAEECYWIGRGMMQGDNFKHANHWFLEALKRWKKGSLGPSKFDILDYYSYSLAEEGMFREALEMTNELLMINSTYVGGLSKKKVIEDWLDRIESKGPKEEKPEHHRVKMYRKLCRGTYERPASETSQLYCRYETKTYPFLRLAPLKQEIVKLDPLVVVYHDAASDREIAKLIELAKPQIKRSVIGDTNATTSYYRISQNAWLTDEAHPIVATLDRRAKYMTGGLDEESYENLQVNNYGPGGFYYLHYDYSESPDPFPGLAIGNRIATLMFYLSDVEQGGFTVFPVIKLAVRPRKGTAVFWYNLRRNGNGDKRTLHAACPVLVGNKWVANKWIHEYHQEFIRPCDLDPKK